MANEIVATLKLIDNFSGPLNKAINGMGNVKVNAKSLDKQIKQLNVSLTNIGLSLQKNSENEKGTFATLCESVFEVNNNFMETADTIVTFHENFEKIKKGVPEGVRALKNFNKSNKDGEKNIAKYANCLSKSAKNTKNNSESQKKLEQSLKKNNSIIVTVDKKTIKYTLSQQALAKASKSNSSVQKKASEATKKYNSVQKDSEKITNDSKKARNKDGKEIKKNTDYINKNKKRVKENSLTQESMEKQIKKNSSSIKRNRLVTKELSTIYVTSQGATEALEVAQSGLNGAFKANPVGLVIESLMIAISLFQLAYENIEPVKKAIQSLMKIAKEAAKWIGGIFGGKKSSKESKSSNGKKSSGSTNVKYSGGPDTISTPKLARGTNNWKGGLALTQEKGGEIMDLPRGTRVYPHDKSIQMARAEGANKGSGANISINISKLADKVEVRSDNDIDSIANKLATKLEKIMNNVGKVEFA